jgi:hypothetical protein
MQAYTFYQTFANAMTTYKQTGIHTSMQNLLLKPQYFSTIHKYKFDITTWNFLSHNIHEKRISTPFIVGQAHVK